MLQAGKYAYLATKAYKSNKSFFDSLFESPLFWGVVILGIVIYAAAKWTNEKSNKK